MPRKSLILRLWFRNNGAAQKHMFLGRSPGADLSVVWNHRPTCTPRWSVLMGTPKVMVACAPSAPNSADLLHCGGNGRRFPGDHPSCPPKTDCAWPCVRCQSFQLLDSQTKRKLRPSQPRQWAPSLEHCGLLTKARFSQGDISEVSGPNEKTTPRTNRRRNRRRHSEPWKDLHTPPSDGQDAQVSRAQTL